MSGDKVQQTCQFIADTYGVKPGRTWGQLKDLDLRTFWGKNSCDTKVTVKSTVQDTAKMELHAYVADWSDLERLNKLAKFDYVINAFWALDEHGDVTGRNKPREQVLARLGTRVLAAVGGWGSSTPFSTLFARPSSRLASVLTLGAAVEDAHWHGIDLNWEYPQTADDFVGLLAFVSEYRLHWPLHTISMAVPAIPNSESMRVNAGNLGSVLDYLHVMTYDYTGSWTSTLGPVSGVSQGKESMATWSAVPRKKLVMGSAWYGRIMGIQRSELTPRAVSWEDLPYSGAQQATWGWTMSWIDGCRWASNPNSSKAATWEDAGTVAEKIKVVKDSGYGGIFCWEWSQDNGDLATAFLAS